MNNDQTALSLATVDKPLDASEPTPIRVGETEHDRLSLAAKRALDFLVALALMVVGAPVFLLLALLVKITSSGPILFKQIRLGKDGRPFSFYKFRTMYHDNDDTTHRDFCAEFINGHLEAAKGNGHNGNGNGNGNGHKPTPLKAVPGNGGSQSKVFKMVDDPRITRIGGFLRRTSLDELPQFWNVLRGEMSLVGPRPPIHYELDHYQEWHKDRLKVKPGLTGLWQVSGRSQVPFDEMVMLDLCYIREWSLGLDLKILLKTLPVVVRGDGAY